MKPHIIPHHDLHTEIPIVHTYKFVRIFLARYCLPLIYLRCERSKPDAPMTTTSTVDDTMIMMMMRTI